MTLAAEAIRSGRAKAGPGGSVGDGPGERGVGGKNVSGNDDPAWSILDARTLVGDSSDDIKRDLNSRLFATAPKPLLLHHLEVLSREVREDVLGQLRAALEDPRLRESLRVVLTGEDPDIFAAGPYSSVEQYFVTFRTPWFDRAELTLLAQGWEIPAADQAALACLRATGGQPLLAQQFFRAVKGNGVSPEDGAYALLDHPPAALRHWQVRLAEVLRRSIALSREVERFTTGTELPMSRGRFEHWPLFVTGWLGLTQLPGDPEPTYRFSEVHRAWARDVLRTPQAFRVPTGDEVSDGH